MHSNKQDKFDKFLDFLEIFDDYRHAIGMLVFLVCLFILLWGLNPAAVSDVQCTTQCPPTTVEFKSINNRCGCTVTK